ncbi:hypothetical protein L596_022658 [Steinernema carpocapsae]|uniref:Uncharacterized protein n=1 Tax=Steinernema carpocapsae TaxID=34508 RepID=A0A4U5MMS0_STECR|nr:hypothetical protein L596_022658 [Steinernema carpocapsae]
MLNSALLRTSKSVLKKSQIAANSSFVLSLKSSVQNFLNGKTGFLSNAASKNNLSSSQTFKEMHLNTISKLLHLMNKF